MLSRIRFKITGWQLFVMTCNATLLIFPLHQERLKERLGDRFRELDTPLLVEWPDGRKGAILLVIEEKTDPILLRG